MLLYTFLYINVCFCRRFCKFFNKRDGGVAGVSPAEGVADKQQSAATCLGARGKLSPLKHSQNILKIYFPIFILIFQWDSQEKFSCGIGCHCVGGKENG